MSFRGCLRTAQPKQHNLDGHQIAHLLKRVAGRQFAVEVSPHGSFKDFMDLRLRGDSCYVQQVPQFCLQAEESGSSLSRLKLPCRLATEPKVEPGDAFQ